MLPVYTIFPKIKNPPYRGGLYSQFANRESNSPRKEVNRLLYMLNYNHGTKIIKISHFQSYESKHPYPLPKLSLYRKFCPKTPQDNIHFFRETALNHNYSNQRNK